MTTILLHGVEKFLDGARHIGKLLKQHLSEKTKTENGIPAEIVNRWYNERINNLTISRPLSLLVRDGLVTGTGIGTVCLSRVSPSKFYVKPVTKKKRKKRTKRGNNAKHNKL